MSHAAHRFGTVEELRDDYNILVKPYKGLDDVNDRTREEAIEKTNKLADIAFEHGAVNLGRRSGCTGRGDDYTEIMNWRNLQGFFATFIEKEKVKQVLVEYKKKDYGISVVAGGLIEEIFDICKDIGLKPHTVLYSFGVWGKTETTPDEDHLKITTLCGHSMVPPKMIDHYVDIINKGEISLEEAGKKLAKPCPCGIFNVPRTVEVLKKLTRID
jgi:hypothetical protein